MVRAELLDYDVKTGERLDYFDLADKLKAKFATNLKATLTKFKLSALPSSSVTLPMARARWCNSLPLPSC